MLSFMLFIPILSIRKLWRNPFPFFMLWPVKLSFLLIGKSQILLLFWVISKSRQTLIGYLDLTYFGPSLLNGNTIFLPSGLFPSCTGKDSKFDFKVFIAEFISSMYNDSISFRTNFGISFRFCKISYNL